MSRPIKISSQKEIYNFFRPFYLLLFPYFFFILHLQHKISPFYSQFSSWKILSELKILSIRDFLLCCLLYTSSKVYIWDFTSSCKILLFFLENNTLMASLSHYNLKVVLYTPQKTLPRLSLESKVDFAWTPDSELSSKNRIFQNLKIFLKIFASLAPSLHSSQVVSWVLSVFSVDSKYLSEGFFSDHSRTGRYTLTEIVTLKNIHRFLLTPDLPREVKGENFCHWLDIDSFYSFLWLI